MLKATVSAGIANVFTFAGKFEFHNYLCGHNLPTPLAPLLEKVLSLVCTLSMTVFLVS